MSKSFFSGVIFSACSSSLLISQNNSPIDLSNWKLTLPIGAPLEVLPQALLSFQSDERIKPYMYLDTFENGIVFYTEAGLATTANSSYSRSELREQMIPGNNNVNWTFKQGGQMYGELRMKNVTKSTEGNYHRVIFMQIHGRLTNEQKNEYNFKDNDAPPVLKLYWENGKVRVARKILSKDKITKSEILSKSSWKDESRVFKEQVGFSRFKILIKVSDNVISVNLNDKEEISFSDDHVEKWGVFENYFKAGNYFQSKEAGSSASVIFYDLKIIH